MAEEWKPRRKFSDPTKLSRKVFDKHVDQMERKLGRVKEDYRADLKALLKRLLNLENQLETLHDHVARHCQIMTDEDGQPDLDTRDS